MLQSSSNHEAAVGDGGPMPGVYEVGNNLTLGPANRDLGLVGYWKFDEGVLTTANDSSGKGNNGTLNGPTWQSGSSCNIGSCLSFDGVNDYVTIPDSDNYSQTTTGTITVSAWMRPDVIEFVNDESTGYVHWLGKGVTGQHEWVFRMYSYTNTEVPPRPNRISFYVFNLVGGFGVGSYFQDTVIPGQWIHVVGVIDKGYTYIYKNGVLRDSDYYPSFPITPGNGTAPVRVGTRDFGSYFQGAIDDVRIYNRALSASEIQAIYNAK